MTWYILAHMPYFRRPGHKLYETIDTEQAYTQVIQLQYPKVQGFKLLQSFGTIK